MNTQAVEIGGKARFLAGHAVIADQRQAQAAANGCAFDHADQRLARAKQAHARLVDAARELRVALIGTGEVGAGAKHLAFGLQDHYPALR
ncbi:hypothetical protein D3C85_1116540 [compost metagenome]